MDLVTIENAVDGRRRGDNVTVNAISTDSRTIAGGELFVALRGASFDGHKFVEDAVEKGARAAMVDTPLDAGIPQVVVDNTEIGLGRLSADWRQRFNVPLVAVTGSNGKTTVKEMIGCILRQRHSGVVPKNSFNNAVGLPLTLLRMRDRDRFAVVEIGMNQVGEIEYLTRLAAPTVVVITNAGPAHLENLKSVKQVAIEKSRIISCSDNDAQVVLNRDDPHFEMWREQAGARSVTTFGFDRRANVRASCEVQELVSQVRLETSRGTVDFELALAGEHNVLNAAAAAAAALCVNAGFEDIRNGLQSVRPVRGRLEQKIHCRGGQLLDDTYNANPVSLAAAIKVLAELGGDRRLVIGDMFELGESGERHHRQIGALARATGIGRLYAVGPQSRFAVEAFGRGARHFKSQDQLVEDLLEELDATTKVLVKGSRGMQMERIVERLVACDQTREELAC